MDRLIIAKKDESTAIVSAPDHVLYELRDYYTVFAKDYKFHPLFKNRVWDGKIRHFDIRTNTLPLGLTVRTCAWAKKRGYSVQVDFTDEFKEYAEFSEADAEKFVKSLKLPKNITPRDYQMEAFLHGMRNRRCVMELPTASGKSLVIYMMTMKLMKPMHGEPFIERGIIIVPTTTLVEQLYSDFEEYSGGFAYPGMFFKAYSGAKNPLLHNKPVCVISTWQTLHSSIKKSKSKEDIKLLNDSKWIIGDEAHHFSAKSLKDIMTKCVSASSRIGVTGSLDDDSGNKFAIEGNFGPVRKIISSSELMNKGVLSKLHIKGIMLKHPDNICESRKKSKWKYQDELDYMMANNQRNEFIAKLALKTEGNTLILYNHIEKHGEKLKAELDRLITQESSDREVFYIHGGVGTQDREFVRKYVNNHSNCIVLASYGTFSTGINIPNLQNAILALGFKSKIRNLQSIGRTLRLDGKTNMATIYDICDDLRTGKDDYGFLQKHFLERTKLYYKEGFNVTLHKVSLS